MTPFSQENFDFSAKAHTAARKKVYPHLFGIDQKRLLFRDATSDILDFDFGIDRLVRVQDCKNPERFGFVLTVQERFRKIEYVGYDDVTITEFNNKTGICSEIYKLNSNLFVYGFYDEKQDNIPKVVVFDCTKILISFIKNEIEYDRFVNPRTQQEFITINYGEIEKQGAVFYQHGYDRPNTAI